MNRDIPQKSGFVRSFPDDKKTPVTSSTTTPPVASIAPDARLLSLDAYRGMIMVALAFNGFGLVSVASAKLQQTPESSFWQQVKYQFSHVEWSGCAFWDLIQPSFMFMVGVSMAYSYVKRQSQGDSWISMFGHALIRSLVLILLGVFLSSTGSDTKSTNWAFMNVLSQIGLGYPFLFLFWGRHVAVQAMGVALLLAGTWWGYSQHTPAGIDLENGNSAVGITTQWAQANLTGIAPAWHKNANLGQSVDLQVLNLFPRETPFEFNAGGYQTINFIPSLATMLLGLICGEILRYSWTGRRKLGWLVAMGCVGVVGGLIWHAYGCPIVKRIWTPSWALLSTGICCLILATLYGVIDIAGWRLWSMFFVIVGMNSIAIYMMSQMLKKWTAGRLKVHLGQNLFEICGPDYAPLLNDTAVGLAFWCVCYWMYRQRIFVRV